MNGLPLDLNQQGLRKTATGFEIETATSFNEGFYQCITTNQYGSAVSNVSRLQRALLGVGDQHKNTLYAVEGQPFQFKVSIPKCFPPPTFSWVIGKEVDENPKEVVTSNRMQISQNGEKWQAAYYRKMKCL